MNYAMIGVNRMSKELISAKLSDENELELYVDKETSFEQINMAISHFADFTISQWADRTNTSIEESTETYLEMLKSYVIATHKDDYNAKI